MSKGLRIVMTLALAATIGCQAGSTFHGWVEMGQWTPSLEADAGTGSDGTFDLVSTGGLDDRESLWSYDVGIRFTRASGSQLGAHAFNIGYFDHEFEGGTDGVIVTNFGGVPLDGTLVSDAELSLFKFSYEEPSSGSGGERTGGLIGIHQLNYNLSVSDGNQVGRIEDSAMMFVIGYKVAYYSQNLMYFLNIEWMDLDTFNIGEATGEVLDSSGGLRWVFDDSGNMAITLGYRLYDANLQLEDDAVHIVLDGAYFSFFVAW